MNPIEPAIAAVRPRVSRRGEFEHRLLEDVIAEISEENPTATIRIEGGFGSGKTMALRHLAAVFTSDERFLFLDEPTNETLVACGSDRLVVAMFPAAGKNDLRLDPWGDDELLQYLLAKHPAACSSVMNRLGGKHHSWPPQLAALVLDRFAVNSQADDPENELHLHVRAAVSTPELFSAVGRYCLATELNYAPGVEQSREEMASLKCSQEISKLLRFDLVRTPLAAVNVVSSLKTDSAFVLPPSMPQELVMRAGELCRSSATAVNALLDITQSPRWLAQHAIAGSILFVANPTWQPVPPRADGWQLRGGYFSGADWPAINLQRADLSHADLSSANLAGANLARATAYETQFDGSNLARANLTEFHGRKASFSYANFTSANLEKARLHKADCTTANFTSACLQQCDLIGAKLVGACFAKANLTGANLSDAIFDETDLTDAKLNGANLSDCDLRTARLHGAVLVQAKLTSAQLEDVVLPKARLSGAILKNAHLTGSKMPMADLTSANLSGAGLAEIDWEGADLRNANLRKATFHMGSSRSGLVGSPIACEGSKTGFYTDEFENKHFKAPEEIRKANLRHADLRGAKIDKLDFYLVDLRDAKLDESQRLHALRCGAILENPRV